MRDFSFSSGLCGALVLSGAMFAFSDFANAQTTASLSSLLNQDQDKIERASKPEGVTVSDHPKSKTLKNHKKNRTCGTPCACWKSFRAKSKS